MQNRKHSSISRPRYLLSIVSLTLAACGGGGGSSGSSTPPLSTAQQCAPTNTYATPSLRTGSLSIEKQWMRSYFDQAYLWYSEVPNVNANAAVYSDTNDVYTSLDNYFQALKTPATTPSGKREDQFSFTYPTDAWKQLSSSGVEAGYGIGWTFDPTPGARNIHIGYIDPNSPAVTAGLQRGDLLVTADGTSADVSNTDPGIFTLNEAVFPSQINVSHSFVFSRSGSANVSVTMTAANVTKTPVLTTSVITATDGAKVGYIVFNDHIAPAEAQLITAITTLKAQNVTDLVLDIRYNGGGYLFIASELAYMIAGPTPTNGQVFEKLSYNAKRTADTNNANSSTPFYNQSCILDANNNCTSAKDLPTLNLSRVYVLTKSDTCSASEAVINGLRGVNVDVRQIGSTTCGKPYGFTAKDNCGISYFPIEFKGTNAKGFGDYADGFIPGGTGATNLPGCAVADDFSKALGNTSEGMLAAALSHRITGSCPVAANSEQPQALGRSVASPTLSRLSNPVRENRILLPNR